MDSIEIEHTHNSPAEHREKDAKKPTKIGSDLDVSVKEEETKSANRLGSLVDKLCKEVNEGTLEISERKRDIAQLIEEKISKEEAKHLELKAKREELQLQLAYLDQQLGAKSKDAVDVQPAAPGVLSKEEHKKIVHRIIKQHQEHERKRLTIIERAQKVMESQAKSESDVKKMESEKARSERKEKIRERLKLAEEQQKRKIEEAENGNRRLDEIKSKKFLFHRLEEKYQSEVVLANLEEKKRKLKEIRDLSKGFNVGELLEHEKQYLQKKQKSLEGKADPSQEHKQYQPPEKVPRLANLLEEERVALRSALEAKKRSIEEKMARQEAFVAHLKQHFKPKIDLSKKEEIEKRRQPLPPKPAVDKNAIGIAYLQHAKQLKKCRPETVEKNQTDSTPTSRSRKAFTNYLIPKRDALEYQQIRRNRLERILNADANPDQKLKQLQLEAERASEEARRKEELMKYSSNHNLPQEAMDALLTGIKAKMGIIQLYNK